MELLSEEHVHGCIAEAAIVGPVVIAKFRFQAISSQLCHPAAALVTRITPDLDSPGIHLAKRRCGELPDHFGDIAPALHRRTAPVPNLELGYSPVARVETCAEHEPAAVFEKGMNGEVLPRLVAGLGSLKDGFRVLEGLECSSPIHPDMQVGKGFFNGFLDRERVLR